MEYKTIWYTQPLKDLISNVFKTSSLNTAINIAFLLCPAYDVQDLQKTSRGKLVHHTQIDASTFATLKSIRATIKQTYHITLSYSQIAELVITKAIEPTPQRIVSMNVHGYKSRPSLLADRCRRIAELLNSVMPYAIFLQELVTGGDMEVIKAMTNTLKANYKVVLPIGFNPEQHYNYTICAALIREDAATDIKIRALNTANESIRFRYNYFACGTRVYLNVWIPQTFETEDSRRQDAAELWALCLKTISLYTNTKIEFYFMGDLNSYFDNGRGLFENELREVEQLMFNTKTIECLPMRTTPGHTLDQIYANRHAIHNNSQVYTNLFEPSIRDEELSDHDALVMCILPLRPLSKTR